MLTFMRYLHEETDLWYWISGIVPGFLGLIISLSLFPPGGEFIALAIVIMFATGGISWIGFVFSCAMVEHFHSEVMPNYKQWRKNKGLALTPNDQLKADAIDQAERILDRHNLEVDLRKGNATINEAWDQYQVLISLVNGFKKDKEGKIYAIWLALDHK